MPHAFATNADRPASPMVLYGIPPSGHVHRVQLMLSPYRLVDVDMRAGEHKREPFLTLNPFGQIPVLDDNGIEVMERWLAASAFLAGPAPTLADVAARLYRPCWRRRYFARAVSGAQRLAAAHRGIAGLQADGGDGARNALIGETARNR
jgi:glutathione S-transferase